MSRFRLNEILVGIFSRYILGLNFFSVSMISALEGCALPWAS